MAFIKPMLASPMPDGGPVTLPGLSTKPSDKPDWIYEEKWDGIRIIGEVSDKPTDLLGGRGVQTWSRNGILHFVPPHIRAVLEQFPACIFDGELYAPGKRSYGTAAHVNASDLVLAVFDILEVEGDSAMKLPLCERKLLLFQIVRSLDLDISTRAVRVESLRYIYDADMVERAKQSVWDRDGEGLILKRLSSVYQPGKRLKDWIKIKKLQSAVMRLTFFAPGKMGPYATWIFTGDDGCMATVKWKNLEMLAQVSANPNSFLGRLARIEYQERTPDGGYRHPRFDRWEDE